MPTITRATWRPGLASALIAAAALAACGGSDDKPASTAATSVATTTKAPPAPDGRLSAGEYDSMRGLVASVGKLEKLVGTKAGIRGVRSACRDFASAPRTELMLANRSLCAQIARLLEVVGRFQSQQKVCEQAAQAGDVSCFAQLYRSLAGTARVLAVRAEAANGAMQERRLTGACARAVGTPRGDLAAFRAVARDARGAALALEAKDQARLQRALAAITRDFESVSDETTTETLRRLRACRS